MARFTIYGTQLTTAEIAALKALVEQAGGADSDIEVVTVIDHPDLDAENDVILFLGTSAVCADSNLEDALVRATNGPRRAIWVWPQAGGENPQLPPAAEKYSYSYIAWSADKLRAVAADDDVICFETATGKPVPKVPTERNLCVEEKAIPK